jgi:RHS repeat-associated protein
MDYARNPSPIRSPIPGQLRCSSQSLKPYNRSHMQPALRSPIPDASLAVFPVNGENSHQGLAGRNPALYPVREVCNFTVLLGLQSTAVLNRVGPRSTGKERDQESGNDYFGARYYSSSMGRFMSPDWSAKEDPVPYAHLDDPQSLNLYSYVENNPLFKADLDGHGCPPDCSTGNDVVDFVNGLTNAWGSDNVLGAGRNNQSTYAGQLGQAFGDFGAAAQGGYETLLGVGGDIVGGGLDATGVGAIAGVPINVVSTAAAIHGTATGTEGATHLAMALAKPASGKGSVPKEQRAKPRTATDKERTEMRKEQGGNCAHCDKPLGDEPGVSHHDPVRHSDGGTEQKLVHEACHQELHGKC